MKKRLIGLSFFFLVASGCLPVARGAVESASHFLVDVWTTDEGLPQNSVFSVTQSRDGYLWLGTLSGLVRFDGIGRAAGAGPKKFPVFNQSIIPLLKSSRIVKTFEDKSGNLWICTEGGGVTRVAASGTMKHFDIGDPTREGRVVSISEAARGQMWFYTDNGKIYVYADERLYFWKAAVSVSLCRALATDSNNIVYLGNDSGIIALDSTNVKEGAPLPALWEAPAEKLDFLLSRSAGGYWRLANGTISRWAGKDLQATVAKYPWSSTMRITAACEDKDGNLVVGTYGEGVFWFDANGKSTHLEGLSYTYILSLVSDREGSLWVGTDGGGLNRVRRQVFATRKESEGNVVQSVCDDGDGGAWAAYNWERVDHCKTNSVRQFTRFWPGTGPSPQRWYMRSVFRDRAGQIWLGGWNAGGPALYTLFQLKGEQFLPVPGVNQDISAIFQDKTGTMWLGTQQGLVQQTESGWKLWTRRDGLSSDFVKAIAQDKSGDIWVGTEGGGLNRLSQGKFSAVHFREGLPGEDVTALFVDGKGVLWAGTTTGLGRYANGIWNHFGSAQGFPSESVGYMLEDSLGYFWFGSTAGLIRVPGMDLENIALGQTNLMACRIYGKNDGLPSAECTSGSQPGAARDKEGRLWFPTIKGLAYVNPSQLTPNTNPPPVVIEAILIDGTPLATNSLRLVLPERIALPAGREQLEIDYASLNLAAPDRARFKYWLQGHERAWSEETDLRSVRYTKLHPKKYQFLVKACNEDGVWNEQGASLMIVIEPPFWQTWWFLTLATLLTIGVVVGIVHYLSTQKLHRQLENLRQQEALERERARIARDLHDQLGANLTQVTLLGEMAESDKNLPEEVESHARQICQTARETTHALDEIVWTVNPSNDTVDGLINYVCKYAQDYLQLAGLRYRLEVPEVLPHQPVSPELRHNVFLAAKESINNVIKHAEASCVWLRVKPAQHWFTIEIEDDGKGLPPEADKKGRNGLVNMRKRMADVGGKFEISPGAERGAIVRLTMPL